MRRKRRVPEVVVRRLAMYLRVLREMDLAENRFVSSKELGEKVGVTSAQVRKDLAMFGEFGKQGVGYQGLFLGTELKRILNADRTLRVCIIGAGELGTALARYNLRRYQKERDYPFRIVAIFDNDPSKVGVMLDGIKVSSMDQFKKLVRDLDVQIAIITVPAQSAQNVIDMGIEANIKGFLNYAPVKVNTPEDIKIHHADVSLDLHQLAFYL